MKIHVPLTALMLLVTPTTASAGLWDWFDQLSGPGPFRGHAVYWTEFRILSLGEKPDLRGASIEEALARDDENLRWLVTLRYTSMSNEHDSTQVPVRLTPADFAVMYRLPLLRGNVDLGVGTTVLTFSGSGFQSFSRVGLLLPKITAAPLAFIRRTDEGEKALLRSLKVYFDLTWTGQFSAADFSNAVPPFPGDTKPLRRFGVQIDFMTLGYAITHW